MFKLLKHDIKDSYLEVVILCGALLLASLIIMFGTLTQAWFIFGLGYMIWFIISCALGFILIKIVVKSFHSKLFTNVGYLTLTTPVSIDKILISKILVSMLWNFVAMLAMLVSYVIMFSSVFMTADAFDFLLRFFGETFILTLRYLTFSQVLLVLEFGLVALTVSVASIVTLLFVLTLVNTGRMRKYKFIKALVIYILLVGALYTIYYVFLFLFLPIGFTSLMAYFRIVIWSIIISNILWIVGFYFFSRLLIVKKLELE